MRKFIYFIPNADGLPEAETLKQFGIDNPKMSWSRCNEGPNGAPGILAVPHGAGITPEFIPDQQRWTHCSSDGACEAGVHVGLWLDDMSTPLMLERDEMIAGKAVTMHDGKQWVVPLLRYVNPDTHQDSWGAIPSIPHKVRDGWVATPDEKYVEYWNMACDWWDSQFKAFCEMAEKAQEGEEFEVILGADWDQCIDKAASILRLNYDITDDEITLLRLFQIEHDGTSPEATMILNACSSFDLWLEVIQKKTNDAITLEFGT